MLVDPKADDSAFIHRDGVVSRFFLVRGGTLRPLFPSSSISDREPNRRRCHQIIGQAGPLPAG